MDILSPPPGAWLTLQAASVDRTISVTTAPDTTRPKSWGLAVIPLRITSSSLHVRRCYSRRFPLPGTILTPRITVKQLGPPLATATTPCQNCRQGCPSRERDPRTRRRRAGQDTKCPEEDESDELRLFREGAEAPGRAYRVHG